MLRALEKDPARRYQSAEEFIAALEQARRAPTRPARDGADAGRAVVERRAGSRWWVWALVALVLAALAVGAYFLLAGKR